MPRRLDLGMVVAGAGALLLLVSLFLDWFGSSREGFTAWTVYEVLDIVLSALAVLAISSVISRAGIEPRAPEAPLLALGAGALVLVIAQLLNHPPAATELDPKTGVWLGLSGAALLVAGSVMSVARISLAVETRRPAEPEPEPEPETVKLSDPPPPA